MHSHHDTPCDPSHPNPKPFQFQPTELSAVDIRLQPPVQVLPTRGVFAEYVLILVSDPIECARIGRALCKLGHSVSLVCDAHDAAAILVNSRFNLVLIEIDPPSLAARMAIKRLLPTLTTAFAILSSTPDEERASLPAKLPLLTAIIAKPANDDSLRALFEQKF